MSEPAQFGPETHKFDIQVPTGVPYFLSYASMVVPYKHAFVANSAPKPKIGLQSRIQCFL